MMRIFNDVNPMTNSNLENSTMPIMQKILLCTILLCNKEMKIKEILLSKVKSTIYYYNFDYFEIFLLSFMIDLTKFAKTIQLQWKANQSF